uniref:GRIP domain-containing protein n=1 Tax=Eutreptiella gymnastica TaxID=73025 RepID=A0A7S4FR55_9EUGL|mmetsp:Transcript_56184/g.93356  ORF Transcript_56184/g.93356 Transcript_56184/m.93356 type:complete len:707 (+) Transcript_56184:37-2157(+)
MWLAKTDKLKDLSKGLSEFAREVVAPTYENEEDAFEEEAPADEDGHAKYERYESMVRALRETNAAQQQKIVALSGELEKKKHELAQTTAQQQQADRTHSDVQQQLVQSQASEEQLKLQLQQLQTQQQQQGREHQATLALYQQTKSQIDDFQNLYDKQKNELLQHAESELAQLKAEYCRYLDNIRAALGGHASSSEELDPAADVHVYVDEILNLVSSVKSAGTLNGGAPHPPPDVPESPSVSSQSSLQAVPDADAEHLRATIKTLRQDNEQLKKQITQLQLQQHEHEQKVLKMQQEFQQQSQQAQALQQQQAQAQTKQLQQHHAQEKAAWQAETQQCIAELEQQITREQKKSHGLEQQIGAMHQKLSAQQDSADLEERYNEARVVISRLTNQLREQTAASSTHQTNFQQELAEVTQKLNKASRQVTVLQQENAELKEKGDISAKMMENNEAETEHFREQLKEKASEIKTLTQQLTAKDSEVKQQEQAVDNLQSVLDMFHTEREAEIQSRMGEMRLDMDMLQSKVEAGRREAEKERMAQVALREEHEKLLRFKEKQINCLEDKVQQLLGAMEEQMKRMNDENSIDKTLVSGLFLRYINAKSGNNSVEVLKVMSRILNWDADMQRKVGLTRTGFWSALMNPAETDDTPVIKSYDAGISDLWINFLEKQVDSAVPPPRLSTDAAPPRPPDEGNANSGSWGEVPLTPTQKS